MAAAQNATPDPFSLAFSGLWQVLNNSPAFAAAVPLPNQIRYDTSRRQPEKSKELALSADRPQVMIIPYGGVEYPLISSSSTKMVKRYQISVSLGDLRVTRYLYPIEFIIACALVNWQATLTPIEWQGEHFIKILRISDVAEGRRQADMERGIQSWAAIFSLSLEMWFTSSKLANLEAGAIVIGDANLPPQLPY